MICPHVVTLSRYNTLHSLCYVYCPSWSLSWWIRMICCHLKVPYYYHITGKWHCQYVIGHFQMFLKLGKRLTVNWVNIVLKQTWGLLVCLGLSLCWRRRCSVVMFGAKPLDTRRIRNKCWSERVHSGVTGYVCCFEKIFFLFFPGNRSEEDFPVLCPSFGWTFKVGSSLLRWSFGTPETLTVHCWRRSELGVHLSLSYPLWPSVPLLFACEVLAEMVGCCVRGASTVSGPMAVSLASVSIYTPLGCSVFLRSIQKYVQLVGTLSYRHNLLWHPCVACHTFSLPLLCEF